MTGRELTNIDPMLLAKDSEGKSIFIDEKATIKELEIISKHLRSKRRILVGHNLLTDLTYIYNTFIGPLPDQVAIFKQEIHGLFPTIIDTKYMFTQAPGTTGSNSSLAEICEQLKTQSRPFICLAESFDNYSSNSRFHEAGFDSKFILPFLSKHVTET